METPSSTEPRPSPELDDPSAGNLDKVRDILFGAQARDTDRRFARLEERVAKDVADLRDDIRQRFNALEEHIRRELDTLATRLRSERDERTDATRELTDHLRATAEAFEKRAVQIDDAIDRTSRDLGQRLVDTERGLSDDLRQRTDDLLARLARASADLQHDKADRSTLAALLTDMALRLSGESSSGPDDRERTR